MMQTAKKPIALLAALVLCLSLLSGIVLPQIAQTALAAATDPYAAGDNTMTAMTPVNGQITVEGVTYDLPDDYKTSTIYVPDSRGYFFNKAWTADALGIEDNQGEVFFAKYGDGTTWGNGKVYMMKWRQNAFGSKTYPADFTIPSGESGNYPGYQQLVVQELITAQPHQGDIEGNKRFVYLWPANYTNSTGSTGNDVDNTARAPINDDGETVTDPTEEDLLNVYIFGPQAGKTPFTEDSSAVANGRGTDTSKEFVITSTFWGIIGASTHYDGIADKGTTSIYLGGTGATKYDRTAMHLENVYLQRTTADKPTFNIGGNNSTNSRVNKFYMDNCYLKVTASDTKASDQNLQANICEITNTTLTGQSVGATDQYSQNHQCFVGTCAAAAANCAFLGDYSGSANFLLKNCNIIDYDPNHIFRFNFANYQKSYTKNCNITFDGNYYFNEDTKSTGNMLNMNNVTTANGTKAKLTITNNYCYYGPDLNDKRPFAGNSFSNDLSGGVTINGNTVVSNGSGYLFYSINNLAQADNNLFLDYDGNVLPVRASYVSNNFTGNVSVLGGIVASDTWQGNINDLFTVQRTNANLIVTHSAVESIKTTATTDGTIKGTVTLLCEDGVTYPTDGLFVYRDGVEFDGIFSDAACTTPMANIAKGFGTAYAKAHYAAGNTKATVVYTISEPSKFIVVDPNDVGEYTFNGETYTADNATFVTTTDAAASAFTSPKIFSATPCVDVILLMPGTYSSGLNLAGNLKCGAWIGPKAFVCPVADDPKADQTVQGGRSIDPETEAVFTNYISTNVTNGVYVIVAGITSNRANSNAFTIDNTNDVDRINFFSVQNCYVKNCSNGIYKGNSATCKALLNIYAKGCFFDTTNTSGNIYAVQSTNLYSEHCGHINIAKNASYVNNTPSSLPTVQPLSSHLSFIDGFFIMGNGGSYILCPAWRNNNFDVEDYANGMYFEVDGMYLKYNATNKPYIRLMPGAPRSINLSITDNYFDAVKNTTTAVIDSYTVDDHVADRELRSAVISGNVFKGGDIVAQINDRNSVDISHNFFCDAEGKAQPIAENCSGVVTPEHYYLDEAMTVLDNEVGLQHGDFDEISLDAFPAWTASATVTAGTEYVKSSFVAVDGATVDAVEKDGEDIGDATLVAGDEVQVTVSKNGVSATWTVSLDEAIDPAKIYTGSDYYYDPVAATKADGKYVEGTIKEGTFFFEVGKNVFGDFLSVPVEDGKVRKIHLFAKTYTTLPKIEWKDNLPSEWEIYGVQAGVNPVEIDAQTGIPTGNRANNRGAEGTLETIVTNDDGVWNVSATRVVFDGIAFKGQVHQNDSTASSSSNSIISIGTGKTGEPDITICNCVTIENDPVKCLSNNGVFAVKGAADHKGTIENNFIELAGKGNGFLTWRVTSDTAIQNNFIGYVDGTNDSLMYLSNRTSDFDASTTKTADYKMNINHNRFIGRLAFSDGEKNETGAAGTTYDLSITDNHFEANPNGPGNLISLNKENAAYFNAETETITVARNTFVNTTDSAIFAIYAIYPKAVAASGNTFEGFTYNYGPLGTLKAAAIANDDRVTFDDDNTFVIDGTSYKATDIDNTVDMADLLVSGANALDDTVIREVLDGSAYVFKTKNAMAAKVTYTDADGEKTVYNYIPAGVTDAKVTIINIAGKSAGAAEYSMSVNAAPFGLEMIEYKYEDIAEPADPTKPFSTFWKGEISVDEDWNTELYNAYDIKILDYGMFYSNVKDADAAEFEYVGGVYTDSEGKTRAKMVSYGDEAHKDGDYLKQVYQKYSFRFTNIGYEKYRYGKLYLAYTIGESDVIHYAYSDAAEVNTPAEQPV